MFFLLFATLQEFFPLMVLFLYYNDIVYSWVAFIDAKDKQSIMFQT